MLFFLHVFLCYHLSRNFLLVRAIICNPVLLDSSHWLKEVIDPVGLVFDQAKRRKSPIFFVLWLCSLVLQHELPCRAGIFLAALQSRKFGLAVSSLLWLRSFRISIPYLITLYLSKTGVYVGY